MKELKNKSDPTPAQFGKFCLSEKRNLFTGELIGAGRRSIEATQNIQQSRFPGTRGSDDRDVFSLLDGQGDMIQCVNILRTHPIGPTQLRQMNH